MGYLQTWLLYHNALSRGVEIDNILQYARKSKEKAAVDTESVAELKARLANQEKKIQELLDLKTNLEAGERTSLRNASMSASSYGATAGGQLKSDAVSYQLSKY